MENLINQFFIEGIALDSHWSAPCQQLISAENRQRITDQLYHKFSSHVPLLHQLPPEDNDPIRIAFYNREDNWFHQIFEKEGYNGQACANKIKQWLAGSINCLVLVGGGLSTAKSLYNALSQCFPLAVHDENINSFPSMSEIAQQASLYCVPFITEAPNGLMLHLMEGNAASCWHSNKLIHIRSLPMLLHCVDISIAHKFLCKNTAIFFLTDEFTPVPPCYMPRVELRDFLRCSSGVSCSLCMHCKQKYPLCVICAESTNQ
nr:MAG: hypothetical protein [Otus scops adenovirus]